MLRADRNSKNGIGWGCGVGKRKRLTLLLARRNWQHVYCLLGPLAFGANASCAPQHIPGDFLCVPVTLRGDTRPRKADASLKEPERGEDAGDDQGRPSSCSGITSYNVYRSTPTTGMQWYSASLSRRDRLNRMPSAEQEGSTPTPPIQPR